ncbi:hypothetical protein J6590_103504, partial [Homalodisca vitripennis]
SLLQCTINTRATLEPSGKDKFPPYHRKLSYPYFYDRLQNNYKLFQDWIYPSNYVFVRGKSDPFVLDRYMYPYSEKRQAFGWISFIKV